MPGYPDWQKVETRVQAPVFYSKTIVPNVNQTKGPWYVANLTRVIVEFSVTGTGYYTFTITWWADQALTISAGQTAVHIIAGFGSYANSLPVAAPWMTISIFPDSYVSGDIADLLVLPNSNELTSSALIPTILAATYEESIPASTLINLDCSGIIPGPAQLITWTDSTASVFVVQAWSAPGVWLPQYPLNQTSGQWQDSRMIVLPPASTRLQIANNAAAAHLYSVTLASLT